MATIKTFALGGLDKKSNDLTRLPDKASDMLNMEYDTQSTLKKRNGYGLFSSASSDDLVYYNSKNEFLLFSNGSSNIQILDSAGALKSYNGSTSIPLPSGIPALSNVSISYCENQNNMYFTNTDYSTYVMKYDGSNIYRAGLPTPRKSNATKIDDYPSFTLPSGGYTRIFYSYKDINGNEIYSPYVQYSQGTTGGSVLSINSFAYDANCLENGFFNKYCYRTSLSSATISSVSRTLTVTRHNYVVGDKFLIDTENVLITISPVDKSFLVLDIESVTPTSITFTAASIGSNTISFASSVIYAAEYPVDVRCKVYIAYSSNSTANFTILNVYVLDNSIATNSITLTKIEGALYKALPLTIKFTDIYDSDTLKLMPPICKYIASFGNQIVYSSIQSFFTYSSDFINAPNRRVDYSNNDLIVYSDILTGDGPEGVSELNLVKIGETWDGYITGLRRCNDSMVIFKNRGVFSIDGSLIDGEFQIRKINTNFAGCTSHKSILESDEGLYFQAHNGLYFTNAIGVKKISYEIDSVFNSAEYTTTRAVRLKKKQKSLFYVPELSKIVVVDYYYNQIYFWNAINANKGIVEDSNGDVYFSNGTAIYKFNTGYSDNGSAISAYYATTWHHAGEPSLNKKWLSIRTFALTDDIFNLTIKTQGDWDATDLTNNTLSFGATDQTKFLMLDMKTKRSLRFIFSNSLNNQNLVITGYEITFEVFNSVDKN